MVNLTQPHIVLTAVQGSERRVHAFIAFGKLTILFLLHQRFGYIRLPDQNSDTFSIFSAYGYNILLYASVFLGDRLNIPDLGVCPQRLKHCRLIDAKRVLPHNIFRIRTHLPRWTGVGDNDYLSIDGGTVDKNIRSREVGNHGDLGGQRFQAQNIRV